MASTSDTTPPTGDHRSTSNHLFDAFDHYSTTDYFTAQPPTIDTTDHRSTSVLLSSFNIASSDFMASNTMMDDNTNNIQSKDDDDDCVEVHDAGQDKLQSKGKRKRENKHTSPV
ncbi:hypothetical protein L1887_19666 [Cichorium endivia]|nr:hypothetical protein L1887_19666 [Cichorium endivia]